MINVSEVALGAILGVIGSVVASIWIIPRTSQWLSHRSNRSNESRQKILAAELAEVTHLKENPSELTRHMVRVLLLVTIVWIAQSILDVVLTLATNTTYGVAGITQVEDRARANLDTVTSSIWAVGALASTLILVWAFQLGMKCYRLAMKVRNFEDYKNATEIELASLREACSTGRNAAILDI